ARGRLWMPPHPLADFFETFFVLTRPVYAPIYFPGTALMYVPTVWLKLPYWLMPAVVSGATVGLFYHIVTDLLDGLDGALAAVLLLSLRWFRHLSLIVMSNTVMLFLGMLMFWALLRWRRRRRWGWLALIGACAGWSAITRPIDSIAFVLPVGLAVMWELRRTGGARLTRAAIVLLVFATPFLALQIAFNIGVTGKPF